MNVFPTRLQSSTQRSTAPKLKLQHHIIHLHHRPLSYHITPEFRYDSPIPSTWTPLTSSSFREKNLMWGLIITMSTSSTIALRFLALLIIVVAIGPVYFYQLIEISPSSREISKGSQSSPVQFLPQTINTAPPRLVLHVGLPKTATSAIQCRLSDMERHGM